MRMPGVKNRYTEIWDYYTQRQEMRHSLGEIKKVNKRNGWMKAADLLLLDLYTVWRAIEGLPIWPSYVEGMRGYRHGDDKQIPNAPEILTVEQALARAQIMVTS